MYVCAFVFVCGYAYVLRPDGGGPFHGAGVTGHGEPCNVGSGGQAWVH